MYICDVLYLTCTILIIQADIPTMMAQIAVAVLWVFIGSTITMNSVYGAPVTDINDHNVIKDANLVTDEEIQKFDNNKTSKFSLQLKNGLFEGDIKVSEDLIYKYYDLSDLPGDEGYNETMLQGNNIGYGKQKRAASRDPTDLWPNARVPYQFSSGIGNDLRLSIRNAMDHWEDHTCLRFTFRNGQSDYVEYVNEDPGFRYTRHRHFRRCVAGARPVCALTRWNLNISTSRAFGAL